MGKLTVRVPPDTMLKNASGAEQSMVVAEVRGVDLGGGFLRPASSVRLSGTQPTTVVLSGVLCGIRKEQPIAVGELFGGAPDPKLACILRKSAGLSLRARQAAVWIRTDAVSHSHMCQKFPVTSREWSQARDVVRACGAGPR